MYQDFRDRNTVFTGMMCRYSLTANIGTSSRVEIVQSEPVSGNYFPLLGIGGAQGRVFNAADDLHAGDHPYAALSYAYWKSRSRSRRDGANVVWLVMREVIMLIGAGILIGLPIAWALSRLVQSQLYDTKPRDALSTALATLLLAAVTAAGYIPARRAAASDPLKILRYE